MRKNATLAVQALTMWGTRQWATAGVTAVLFGLIVAVVTVLIPNPWFARDIAPVWWNYPVWILTSVGSGLLAATYVNPGSDGAEAAAEEPEETEGGRSSRWGIAGAFLTWFAVGCPVCNKIALLALGYTGAIQWFAPVQPILAVAAMVMVGGALIWRLKGQVACPVRMDGPADGDEELVSAAGAGVSDNTGEGVHGQ